MELGTVDDPTILSFSTDCEDCASLYLKLTENGSTGYTWEIDDQTNGLKVESSSDYPEECCGYSGVRIFAISCVYENCT